MNELTDIDIDKVNKPYLPLASGEYTVSYGRALVVIQGIASVCIAKGFGTNALVITVVGSNLLGMVYSLDLPCFRWKKYPALAAGCIVVVRSLIVQIGFHEHIRQHMSTPSSSSLQVQSWEK